MLVTKRRWEVEYSQCTSTVKVLLALGGMPLYASQMYVPVWTLCTCVRFSMRPVTEPSVRKRERREVRQREREWEGDEDEIYIK